MMNMMKYTASAKETFDQMAYRVYGDEAYAALLLEANPDQVHKIMMKGGEVINVPPIHPEQAVQSLPPWKRGE